MKKMFGMFAVVAMMLVMAVGAKAQNKWATIDPEDLFELISLEEGVATYLPNALLEDAIKIEGVELFGMNFHCNTFGGNGRVYPKFGVSGGLFDNKTTWEIDKGKLVSNKFAVGVILVPYGDDPKGTTWMLIGIDVNGVKYAPPVCVEDKSGKGGCGWDVWISFSNMSHKDGIPNGKNMQFYHGVLPKPVLPPDDPKETPYPVSIKAELEEVWYNVPHGKDRGKTWNSKSNSTDTLVSKYNGAIVPNSGQAAIRVTATDEVEQVVEIADSSPSNRGTGAFYTIKVVGDKMVLSFPEGFSSTFGVIAANKDGFENGTPNGKGANSANVTFKNGVITSATATGATAKVGESTVTLAKSSFLYIHFAKGIQWKEFGGYTAWRCTGPVGEPVRLGVLDCVECEFVFEIVDNDENVIVSGDARNFYQDNVSFADDATFSLIITVNGEEVYNAAYDPANPAPGFYYGVYYCCEVLEVDCDICEE